MVALLKPKSLEQTRAAPIAIVNIDGLRSGLTRLR